MNNMKTTHTPGPWHRESDGPDGGKEHYVCAGLVRVATVERLDVGEQHMAANARLIAAAPELLETLKRLLDYVVRASTDYDVTRIAGEVIAKAEGVAK